ncbi:NAD(P)-binding protein [Cadophora sp. DSE1049]|nr:NAD(P)-binding protein [Cadophora sp. DSE1049]
MAATNHIVKVAIIGASGNSGKYMTSALLAANKHTITAITRHDSTATFPPGISVSTVDYTDTSSLITALKGQDALIITLSGHTPNLQETEKTIITAAAEAGVPWIFPNEWSPDTANEDLVKDIFIFGSKVATRKAIVELGKSRFVAVSTGFWYEWSLAIAPAFGIDLVKKTATFFDEGETKISVSTWPQQVGKAVTALLSLPVNASDSQSGPCLNDFSDKVIYMNSFTVSQKDMLASAVRVTGTPLSEWTVTKENAKERYENGIKEMKEGNRVGFAKMMYTRVSFEDGVGNVEGKGLANEALGLEVEDLDEATERAFERAKTVQVFG